jgi:cytochrome c oxidase assembly factor CtaG
MITPALLVLGRPWRWLGLASGEPLQIGSDGELVAPVRLRYFDRVALRRTKRLGSQRIILWLIIFMAQVIVWRLSPVVNGLARHSWFTIVESFTLIGVGMLLWLELTESTPMSPTSTRPYRIGVAAVAMWTVWVITYVVAMSHSSWSPVRQASASLVLSKAADQQFAAAVMCALSALVFVPLVFSNLLGWLNAEENPSEELCHLVRVEHARGFFGPKF